MTPQTRGPFLEVVVMVLWFGVGVLLTALALVLLLELAAVVTGGI